MLKFKPILLSVVVLLITSLACAVPGIAAPDANAIGTMVVQTIAANLTQSAQPGNSISPTFTFTPELPTLTPTPTLSPTPVFTSTPLIPLISVSVDTNCRLGPGKAYDRAGALLVGEFAEVFGRDPTWTYWYIRNPDPGIEYCWLWGEYATLTGDLLALPIYTPPPTATPVPALEANYKGLETCTGWWVDIELKNTGGQGFKSFSITLRDTVTDTVLSLSSDGFTDLSGCSGSSKKDILVPGAVQIISAPAFSYDPSGHKLRATITACSEKGVNGLCVSQVITFKP